MKTKTSNLEGTVLSQPNYDPGQIQSPVLNNSTTRAKFKARSRKRRFIQHGHIDEGTGRSGELHPARLQGPKVRPKFRAEDMHIWAIPVKVCARPPLTYHCLDWQVKRTLWNLFRGHGFRSGWHLLLFQAWDSRGKSPFFGVGCFNSLGVRLNERRGDSLRELCSSGPVLEAEKVLERGVGRWNNAEKELPCGQIQSFTRSTPGDQAKKPHGSSNLNSFLGLVRLGSTSVPTRHNGLNPCGLSERSKSSSLPHSSIEALRSHRSLGPCRDWGRRSGLGIWIWIMVLRILLRRQSRAVLSTA